jgi:hypothetical protein
MKSLRNELAMGALVVVSFVGVADAAQIIVFEAPLNNWNQQVSADFAANRELGRAWIDVQVIETIVCAEDASFLWRTYLKSTGRCLLVPGFEQREMDDSALGATRWSTGCRIEFWPTTGVENVRS